MATNETHDPARQSFVESANDRHPTSRSRTCRSASFAARAATRRRASASRSAIRFSTVAGIARLFTGAAAPAAAACASAAAQRSDGAAGRRRGRRCARRSRACCSTDEARASRRRCARTWCRWRRPSCCCRSKIPQLHRLLRLDLSRHQRRADVSARQSADAELQIRAGRLSQPAVVGASSAARRCAARAVRPSRRTKPCRSIAPRAISTTNSNSASSSARRRSLGTPVPIATRERAHLRLLPAQRLVGARHPGVGIPAARPVPRQELRHHRLAVGRHRRGAGAVPHRGVRAAGTAIRRRCRISTMPTDRREGGLDIRLEAYLLTEADARAKLAAVSPEHAAPSPTSTGRSRRWWRTTPATAAISRSAI